MLIQFGYMKDGLLQGVNFYSEPLEYDYKRINRYKGFQYLTEEEYKTQKALYEEFFNRAYAYMDNIMNTDFSVNSNIEEFNSIMDMLDGCYKYRDVFGISIAMKVRDKSLNRV